MQILNRWPMAVMLALPESVQQALKEHLLIPFDDEALTEQFWSDYPTMLIIFDEQDNRDSFKIFDDILLHQTEQALDNPEYSESLTESYTVQLSVITSEGAGLYLLLDNNSPLLKHS